jgi:hypothetical protein
MSRRYKSGKYTPPSDKLTPMITPANLIWIPFSIMIAGNTLKGSLRPDEAVSAAVPKVFMVFPNGVQPFILRYAEDKWQIDGPTEYADLADQLGYVIMGWYQ